MAVISIKNKTKSGSLLVGNAYYVPPSFESIATTTVGAGGASSITFSSIPSTYTHLQIRGIARGTVVDNDESLKLRFNSDSSANYAQHRIYGSGSAVSAAGDASQTACNSFYISANNSTASVFGVGVIDILDYANTNKYKTVRLLTGFDNNGNGGLMFRSNLWMSTSVINELTFTANGGNIAQYSSFALYGIKG